MNTVAVADPSQECDQQSRACSGLRFRDLRRAHFAPGGAEFSEVVRGFLPFVFGAASRLVPEDPSAAERVARAAFETLALRRRRQPGRVLVAAWLLRTVMFAAARERRRLGLKRFAPNSDIPPKFLHRVQRLSEKLLAPVLLVHVLGKNIEQAATALSIKPARVQKRLTVGLGKLQKSFPSDLPTDLRTTLGQLQASPPAGLEQELIAGFQNWPAEKKFSDLAGRTAWSWRWQAVRCVFKTAAATLGIIVLLLGCTAFTFQWLATHGYFNQWFLRNQQNEIAREIPELLEPAKPWPTTEEDRSRIATTLPGNSGELYRSTNLWLATLTFTPEDWESITPSNVEPVNMFGPDGNIVLRNPNASRNGLAGVIGIEYNWATGRLAFAGFTFPNVAVRYRGNGTYLQSLYGPKQSFKVDLNKFGTKQSLARLDELNFLNSIADFSYVRDVMAQQFFRELGVPGPRTAYAYLTLNVPGKFENQPLGLYVLMENIDNDFASDRFGSKKIPIFKPVTPELFKDLGDDWSAYERIYDLKTSATPAQIRRVIDFAKLVTHADDAEFAKKLPEFLDLEAFASFLAGTVLLSSYDGFLSNGQNFYLYLQPASNKFAFIPWDQDHSWGEFGYVGSAEGREQASIWEPQCYNFRFLKRVLKLEEFRAIYRKKLEAALEQSFTKENLYPKIDQLAAVIRPAIAAENSFRSKRFGLSVSTNWVEGPRDGHAEGPKAPVHQIKRFIENRIASVRAQLAGESEGVLLHRH